jgi:hypothetical protein
VTSVVVESARPYRVLSLDGGGMREQIWSIYQTDLQQMIRQQRQVAPLDRAKLSQAKIAERFADRPFVREWDELLSAPAAELRARLTSRDSDIVRLRSSSPFVLTEGVDFTGYDLRLRIQRAARRVVERGLARTSRRPTTMAM